MKLQEIYNSLDALAQMELGESFEDYSQRAWEGLPRMPYNELPLSLQKSVRQAFTADVIQDFLEKCYIPQDYEAAVQSMDADTAAEKLPAQQESYISFETVTSCIPAEDLEKILIRTRNTAIYTVTYKEPGKLAPSLYGNHVVAAFENVIDEYKQNIEEKHRKEDEKQKRKENRALGIKTPRPVRNNSVELVSVGFYQWGISDKEYLHGLDTKKNRYAYIAKMDPEFFEHLEFSNGVMTYDNETVGLIKQYVKGKYTDIQDLDIPLLKQFYTAAVKSDIRHDDYTITVSIPKFFREMGIKVAKGNSADIMEKLHSFENCIGILPQEQIIAKLFVIMTMNLKKQEMTIAMPYMYLLTEIVKQKNEKKLKSGKNAKYEQPYQNKLVYSTIAKERDKAAVDLVYIITNHLLTRGQVQDGNTYRRKNAISQNPELVSYSTSFRSLVKESDLLYGRIQSYAPADRNKALSRAFSKAYELLETHTDINEYFVNLKYDKIIPTMKTLDYQFTATWKGRNADYKPKIS